MTQPLQDKILQMAEERIEAALTSQNRADYQRVVVAGMKAGLEGGPRSILASLQKSKDPLTDAAMGALNLTAVLWRESRGTMPLKALVPAAMTLMLYALDFADKAGIVKVGPGELDKATHVFTNHIFQMLGVNSQMLHTAAAKIQAVVNDPGKMEAVKRAAGVVKSPMASTPTVMPADEGEA